LIVEGNATIGEGAAGVDYTLTFNGGSADGVITWDEGNDWFQYSDDVLMSTTERMYFRDSDIFIYSNTDGELTIEADTLTTIGVAGDTWIGSASNHVLVDEDGAVDFVGTSGLAYGSMYLHEAAVNVDISTAGQGVYVKVTGLTTGEINNVTINSDAFNCDQTGRYKVDWQISADSQGANKTYECDIFLNGVEQSNGSSRRKFAAAGDIGSFSGTAILDVTNAGHDIDLRIKEPGAGAGTDIDILHLNFNVVQIGGT